MDVGFSIQLWDDLWRFLDFSAASNFDQPDRSSLLRKWTRSTMSYRMYLGISDHFWIFLISKHPTSADEMRREMC